MASLVARGKVGSMGVQARLHLLPEDWDAFCAQIAGVEPCAILHSHADASTPREVEGLNYSDQGKRWLFYYIVRRGDLAELQFREVPRRGYWALHSVTTLPVIDILTCFYDGNILRAGRVYYCKEYYDQQDVLRAKSAPFLKWAEIVLRIVKKNYTFSADSDSYASRKVLDACPLGLKLA